MNAASASAIAILAGAVLLDILFGEYPEPLHPVVHIGKLISWLLKRAPASGWWKQFFFGLLLAILVPSFSVTATVFLLLLSNYLFGLYFVASALILKASFALRELGAAADRVRFLVELGEVESAREALRSLCSRDPTELDAEAILGATIQSLAENLSDSFVAPLFYYMLFGIPGAMAYRAVNTLDAMVGYRGSFEALGKASARLDDVANFLPARLTAALLLAAGLLSGKDVIAAWRIFWRDRAKTPSPNGGRPMAIMAGLLGVRLEKKGVYILGDSMNPLTPATVTEAWRLVMLTGLLTFTISALGIVGLTILLRH